MASYEVYSPIRTVQDSEGSNILNASKAALVMAVVRAALLIAPPSQALFSDSLVKYLAILVDIQPTIERKNLTAKT